ncbi:hypothetical protein [Mycobacterium talmoniae]|uniref:Uncharacterized protein n=1 Tax=Mycobacterium talmoniae TaxID=1858794 RepID=A0A1S1NLZ6_9MYCO|nr:MULTISPECIES: hypothetical protein [Mycobacterium]OHV05681.1 hypothetical protein BKN37_05050 [Mycobacterium talmoniae]PQM44575.1 hypothetical protein C1Y40_05264 [Mycobacterium talmoniae]
MNDSDMRARARSSGLRIPRTRGAISGFLLILLGVWGAVIPFVGARFNFAYTPDQVMTWTAARGWLEVLPGAATAFGGAMLLFSANRATAMMGGWLAVLGGAWFVVGNSFSSLLRIGDIGDPVASTDAKRLLIELAYFPGLGAVILFLGGVALGTLSVVSVRDVAHAAASVPPEAYTGQIPGPPEEPQKRGLFRRRHVSASAAR